jgi:preprotein translocase subunit YajC
MMMGLRSRNLGRIPVQVYFLNLIGVLSLLAEDAPAKAPGDTPSMLTTLLPFLLIFVVFYFLFIRPQRREQARRQAMLGGVQKNDRVIIAGGIYGVVTNVQRESDEVTVKVDEATNTKLRVTLSSIARILGDEPVQGGDTK